MNELNFKGIVSTKDNRGNDISYSTSCCSRYQDVSIDEKGVVGELELLLNSDSEAWSRHEYDIASEQVSVKYVVLDSAPDDSYATFDELVAIWHMQSFEGVYDANYEGVCYSEWTCGWGGFTYDESGHDLGSVLRSFDGKWIWLKVALVGYDN